MRTIFAILLVLSAIALGTAGNAAADNSATGSTGTAQVGSTSVQPSAAVVSPATAAVAAPTSVDGSGRNTATDSTGTAQVGGGNGATGSTGTAQVSGVGSSPSASAGTGQSSASATVPVAVGGHPVVLVDRHLLYLPYASLGLCSFGRSRRWAPSSMTSIQRRITAGQAAGRCAVIGPPPDRRGSSDAADTIGCTKSVIRISALFAC